MEITGGPGGAPRRTEGLDHLTVAPHFVAKGLGLQALLAFFATLVAPVYSHRRIRAGRAVSGLLAPVGAALYTFAMVRAVWRAERPGGIRWRGTFYSLARIREQVRR